MFLAKFGSQCSTLAPLLCSDSVSFPDPSSKREIHHLICTGFLAEIHHLPQMYHHLISTYWCWHSCCPPLLWVKPAPSANLPPAPDSSIPSSPPPTHCCLSLPLCLQLWEAISVTDCTQPWMLPLPNPPALQLLFCAYPGQRAPSNREEGSILQPVLF